MKSKATSVATIPTIQSLVNKVGLQINFNNPDFSIYSFQDQGQANFSRLETYRQDYYELLINIDHACPFWLNDTFHQTEQTFITLIRPGDIQQVVQPEQRANRPPKGYAILFSPAFITKIPTGLGPSPSISDSEYANKFFTIAKLVYEEYQNYRSHVSDEIIHRYLEIMLLTFTSRAPSAKVVPTATNRKNELVASFLQELEQNDHQFLTVSDYARLLNTTPKYLSEAIKSECGKTAQKLINGRRIDLAKALLKQTSQSLSEIAYYLNYSDPNYFTRDFKKLTGLTPSQYRKMSYKL